MAESWLESRVKIATAACGKTLPKVELHAHLNGSVRDSTLLERARIQNGLADGGGGGGGGEYSREVETLLQPSMKPGGGRSLAQVFGLFAAIHDLCTHHDVLQRIAREAVEDFAADGVVYLELRTTPKNAPDRGITKKSYMDAVLDGIDASVCGKRGGDGTGAITVRLIASVDRRETTAEAIATVELAASLRHRGVVGIDLSGNPSVGEWATFEPALRLARRKVWRCRLNTSG